MIKNERRYYFEYTDLSTAITKLLEFDKQLTKFINNNPYQNFDNTLLIGSGNTIIIEIAVWRG